MTSWPVRVVGSPLSIIYAASHPVLDLPSCWLADGVDGRLDLVLPVQEAQVRMGMPMSLAAPGSFLLGAGLIRPAVFLLPYPLGEDAQGEIACRVLARFFDESSQVVAKWNHVRVKL